MATQWATFPVEFKGGLISNQSALQQGINAIGSATVLQNFEPDREGGYTKILGFEKFSDTQVPGTGNILGVKVYSAGRYIVARKVDADAIAAYPDQGDGSPYLSSSDTDKTAYYYGVGSSWSLAGVTANTNGGKIRHAEYNFDGDDKIVFVDGTNYPIVYNTSGNGYTNLSSSYSTDVFGAEYVTIFKNTAFYSKGSDLFFTAPYSAGEAEEDWLAANGAGSLNVGYDITGLSVFRDQLIIFTTNSVQRLTGSTAADFRLSPIASGIGCIDGDTIQEIGGDIMYLAPDGLRLLSATDRIGDFALDVASDPVYRDAKFFLDNSSSYSSTVIREKAQYRLFSYRDTDSNEVAKGLLATKYIAQGATGINWGTTKGIRAYVSDSRYTTNVEIIAFANNDGYVYTMNTGSTFDGSAIEALYESPYMPITDPQVRKSFYKAVLYVQPTGSMDIDFSLKFDFDQVTNYGVIQPDPISITGQGGELFYYGDTIALYGPQDANNKTQPDSTDPNYVAGRTYAKYGGQIDNVYKTNVIGSGFTVAIRIEDKSTNPSFTLDTLVLEYAQEDRQ